MFFFIFSVVAVVIVYVNWSNKDSGTYYGPRFANENSREVAEDLHAMREADPTWRPSYRSGVQALDTDGKFRSKLFEDDEIYRPLDDLNIHGQPFGLTKSCLDDSDNVRFEHFVNVDGTPMVSGTDIDIRGNAFGCTD